MEEVIHAVGHPAVRATHASTLEVTTDDYLTPAGDCIVGIEADRAPADFDPAFVAACRDEAARIRVALEADGFRDTLAARGDPALTFDDERGAVVRTSTHVDGRTVAVGADAAAADLDRRLVEALADGALLVVTLSVDP